MSGAVAAAICSAGAPKLVSLVANMGLGGPYTAYKSSPNNVTCTLTVAFDSSGGWAVSHNGETSGGSPTSGSWGTPTTPGAGENYEINVVDNTGAGGGGSTGGVTGAGVWEPMTSGRNVQLSVSDTSLNDGHAQASRSFTVTIRKIGTSTPTSTDTFTLTPQADKTSA